MTNQTIKAAIGAFLFLLLIGEYFWMLVLPGVFLFACWAIQRRNENRFFGERWEDIFILTVDPVTGAEPHIIGFEGRYFIAQKGKLAHTKEEIERCLRRANNRWFEKGMLKVTPLYFQDGNGTDDYETYLLTCRAKMKIAIEAKHQYMRSAHWDFYHKVAHGERLPDDTRGNVFEYFININGSNNGNNN